MNNPYIQYLTIYCQVISGYLTPIKGTISVQRISANPNLNQAIDEIVPRVKYGAIRIVNYMF